MKRTEHNWAARRRGELTRDRGSLRLSPAIDARRRLNTRRADGTRTTADPFGPSDPRHTYLAHAHDQASDPHRSGRPGTDQADHALLPTAARPGDLDRGSDTCAGRGTLGSA